MKHCTFINSGLYAAAHVASPPRPLPVVNRQRPRGACCHAALRLPWQNANRHKPPSC